MKARGPGLALSLSHQAEEELTGLRTSLDGKTPDPFLTLVRDSFNRVFTDSQQYKTAF